jgi:tetratricopeptide (TPR) repeat protein
MSPNYMTAVKAAQKSTHAGKHQAAVTAFERAIAMDATEPLAYVGLADALLAQGNVEAAVGVAREAVGYRPNFGRAQLVLARCLCRQAEITDSFEAKNRTMDEALTFYDKAAALNAQVESIPLLDDWRSACLKAKADALRVTNLNARAQRWEDTRARYGLASIPFGDDTEASKAILELEATTDNGRRWRSEYYHTKRKY